MKYSYIFLILLVLPLVNAMEDASYLSFRVGEDVELSRIVSNHSDVITTATCTIDIYDELHNIIVNDGSMSQVGKGYSYDYVFDTVGIWYAEYTCILGAQTVIYAEFISIQATDIVNTTTSLVSIESKTDIIDTNVDTLLVDVDAVDTIVTSIESKVDIVDTNVDTLLINVEEVNVTTNDNNDKLINLQSDIDYINATTEATHTNSRTIVWILQGIDRIYSYIWEQFSPRTITDSTGSQINKTVISDCVWNEDGSDCENYKEIDNIR